MIRAEFHRRFTKQWHRFPRKLQEQLRDRIKLFRRNPAHRSLRDHALTGKYLGFRSIDITGDVRAVYRWRSKNEAFFTAVGTHSQLYG